jgi:hypothetical protein
MSARALRSKKAKKQLGRSIFNAIRKPGAPPGHPLTQAKPDEKARPAGRKAKHKQRSKDLLGDSEE